MSFESYIEIQGQTQGQFKGSNPSKHGAGLEASHWLEIVDVTLWESALGESRERTSNVVIVRETNRASAQFFRAAITAELLPKVIIRSRQGEGGRKYSLHLTNAKIVKLTRVLNLPGKGGCDRVEFSYEKIAKRY